VTDQSCPKCGFAREAGALECPVCGIVYARYRGAEAGASAPASQQGLGVLQAALPAAEADAEGGQEAPILFEQSQPALAGAGYGVGGGAGSGALTLDPVFVTVGAPQARRLARLAARIVDGVILFAVVFFAVLLAGRSGGFDFDSSAATVPGFMGLAAVVAVNLYFLWRDGQTLGKKALGIRIVRLSGERAGLGRIVLLREVAPALVGAIPLLGAIFALVNVLFIFGEQRRCIHDHFADTKVVDA
jgi:uncharacterized RDD family membrane protein YckC